jgi:hypothetical protein
MQHVRASARLQQAMDKHVLAKAEERVARKNLEFHEGNPCSSPFISVGKDIALICLQQIGFNLGESNLDNDIFLTCWVVRGKRKRVSLGGVDGVFWCT